MPPQCRAGTSYGPACQTSRWPWPRSRLLSPSRCAFSHARPEPVWRAPAVADPGRPRLVDSHRDHAGVGCVMLAAIPGGAGPDGFPFRAGHLGVAGGGELPLTVSLRAQPREMPAAVLDDRKGVTLVADLAQRWPPRPADASGADDD